MRDSHYRTNCHFPAEETDYFKKNQCNVIIQNSNQKFFCVCALQIIDEKIASILCYNLKQTTFLDLSEENYKSDLKPYELCNIINAVLEALKWKEYWELEQLPNPIYFTSFEI